MKTDFESLKQLASYTVNHLKEKEFLEFGIDKRLELVDAMAAEYNVGLATDEDIKEQAIEEVEEKMGGYNGDGDITETEMFNHARKEIIKSYNGETLSGMYLVESINKLAIRVKDFMMASDLVEDVYGTDQEIQDFLVEKLRHFNLKRG